MRLNVSDIDLYRGYLEKEDMPLDKLLRQLRREEAMPAFVKAGNAFHKILERSAAGEVALAEMDGFKFRFDLKEEIALPDIREMKGELEILTSVGPVTLVGKVDGHDLGVRDFKLTNYFDAEKYLNSYQWRAYLLMFKAWRFVYDAFVYDEDKDGTYVIKDYHPLELFAYPALESDVLAMVNDYAKFCAEYMPEKLTTNVNLQTEPRLMSRLSAVS